MRHSILASTSDKKTKKRVLFLLHLPPPVHGSSLIGQTIQLSQKLNNEFDSKYINLLGSKKVNETGKIKVYKIISYLKVIFTLLYNLIAFKPKLCYMALSTTGLAFLKDLILISFIKSFGINIVYHLHNKGIKNQSENRFYNRLYVFAFKNTDVILLSEKLYYDVEAFVPLDRIHICPNGIVDSNLNPLAQKSNTTPTILFLSNLIKSKGLFDLLEALAILELKKIPFQCNIVGGEGDISISTLDKKISDLNLTNSVKYLGKKYGNEKIEVFMSSDIFVLPTFYSNECFPLVLLEAMSFSLPLISTKEGGISDIVEDGINGFLVEKQNPQLLANKLETMIKDKNLRSKMSENSRISFKEKFTLFVFENRMLEILNKLCDNLNS